MKNLVVIRIKSWVRRSLTNKLYSKEDSDDESEDAEILFIGITNSDEESYVDIEAQYMDNVDEI